MQPGFQNYPEQARSWRSSEDALSPERTVDAVEAAATFFHEYARARPEVVALWTFGIGFVLGWKLKPW